MSDILIKGMEMPTTYPLTVTIYPDCQVLSETVGAKGKHGIAVSVPPHGRLIDAGNLGARAFRYLLMNGEESPKVVFVQAIKDAPTIIPAEEG